MCNAVDFHWRQHILIEDGCDEGTKVKHGRITSRPNAFSQSPL
jgi:hypothetical protein